MNELFLQVINRSISASWLILVVLVLRFVLRKAPKWVDVLLWGLVAVRLICPFSVESTWSLIPSAETIPLNIGLDTAPTIHSGINAINHAVNPVIRQSNMPMPGASVNPLQITISLSAAFWILGMVVLSLYTAVSYWRICRNVGTAIRYQDNIFQSEKVTSPFVLGLVRPKIYLSFHMSGQKMEYVVAHEQAHMQRKDHWWKPLGFLLLTIHWFNPLMWSAYVLLCRDIELACDEKVIQKLTPEQRADYTQALVDCSVNRRTLAVCPLAFGEVGVKERVKSVMNYKKPAFWMILLAVLSCAVVAVCFLTNPVSKNTILLGADYNIKELCYVAAGEENLMEQPLQYCVTADYHLYYQEEEGESWNYLGALVPYSLTKEELEGYLPVGERKAAEITQITDSYFLKVGEDTFYLVFQTQSGDTYLAYGNGWKDVRERDQTGSDDTRLCCLCLLESSFHSGYVNLDFFERSLRNTVGNTVYCFASFESDKISGYHIMGFQSGNSGNQAEMNDLGFAVFQTTGEGYRLLDCHVYENAVLEEDGIFICSNPAVADEKGEMRNDNTFDIVFILNNEVDKVERVYHAEGKEDFVQTDTFIHAPSMSVWSWKYSEAATSVFQYAYDKAGNTLSCDSVIPFNVSSWAEMMECTEGTVTRWFDYLDNPSGIQEGLSMKIPEYPEVTFRYTGTQIISSKSFEDSGLSGYTILIQGMPVWNAYITDLTGDGLPDICATYTVGSGIIDSRIVICDYANGASYELSDRGNFDFVLRFDEAAGCLYVDKMKYNTDELVETGRLVFQNDCLQVERK